jgi:hypothetical protein
VADQDHGVATGGEPPRLGVHFGHQRAGGVDDIELAPIRLRANRGGDAVRREDNSGPVRNRVQFVHEHRAAGLQVRHHVHVVHDLLAYVDRWSAVRQRLLDDFDGTFHPGTERPWRGE